MTKSRFIVSKSKLLRQYQTLKDMDLIVSYSLKTFPEIAWVLEENTDSFFLVHMLQSLRFIKDMRRVWFLGQAWNFGSLNYLFDRGIKNFIVDNERDLRTLLKYLENRDDRINLLLRMRMKEHTIYTGKYFVFGMYSHQINDLIPKLRKNKSVNELGIHFHRKTQNIGEWSIKEEISQALKKETLENIDVFNIGGGLPVKYKNSSDINLKFIFEKILEFKKWLRENYGIKTMIEPGRFIAAPCTKLETEIIAIHGNNIIVDASVYNSDMDALIYSLRLLVEGETDDGEPYVIKGCTPCSMDIFRYRVKLKNPKVGDKIVFLNAGAYNFTTDFCNLPKLDIVFVD